MGIRFDEIGNRVRAYRMGHALSADELAKRLGISRAAVYRIEAGGVVKIETLERVAAELRVSSAALLGVGVEYYAGSIGYFERMRQIEEQSDQVVAYFPPLSYLLSSDQFPKYMRISLSEAIPTHVVDRKKAAAEIQSVVKILEERKVSRARRRLNVVNFVSLPEIERWIKLGIIGSFALDEDVLIERRLAAQAEVEHLIDLIEGSPMGVQIGLIEETLPNIAFQLFRTPDKTWLGLSPFRLGGDLPNIKLGVAMLTMDEEPVRFYETLADSLWQRAHKGKDAARKLRAVIARSGLVVHQPRRAS